MLEGKAPTRRNFDQGRELLKIVAIVSMTVDHIGAALYPGCMFLRIVGRLAFPLFSYLLVLGMESTRNAEHYLTRLSAFALISQVPFYLALGLEPLGTLNVFFTLSLGLASLLQPWLILPSLLISQFLNFDYGAYGIALIVLMLVLKENTKNGILAIVLLNAPFLLVSDIQIFSLLALPIILLYKGGHLDINTKVRDRGNSSYPAWRKYLFYIYYPVHLTIIYLVKVFIPKM